MVTSKKAKAEPQYLVCSKCRHVKSLHVPKDQEDAGHYGCMHEDVANGSGGAGSYCRCDGYEETISTSHSGYTSSVSPSDIVA
jgi:hypothetical protein